MDIQLDENSVVKVIVTDEGSFGETVRFGL